MTMTPEAMTQFVDNLYAACAAGDWDAVEDMLTEDFAAYEADALPMAGTYRGRGGLKELFVRAMTLVDVSSLERHALTVGNDRAIAVLTMHFADPALAPAELCEMFVFRDRLCCEIRPYYYEPSAFAAAASAKSALSET